ncbi:hypothetical protein COJ85_01800 [Bacillus sp. AFS076308]|nr:hypothetical protein COJ85_01800 [Bacillus sp. AFS076308]PGV50342.1 hypothetical protein COD92_18385 [Bacillus sp. AFS037270]
MHFIINKAGGRSRITVPLLLLLKSPKIENVTTNFICLPLSKVQVIMKLINLGYRNIFRKAMDID